ncbi:hypothetical protein J6590_088692, partial [Homalodisca vitripennis]
MQLPQCDHKNHQPSLQLIYSNKGITSAPKRSLVNDSDIIWEIRYIRLSDELELIIKMDPYEFYEHRYQTLITTSSCRAVTSSNISISNFEPFVVANQIDAKDLESSQAEQS